MSVSAQKEKPFSLAVDIGCGSGQGTRGLAPHFDKVVGIDLSEAQIEEARKMDGPDNISYRLGQAEELEFADGSVDLVTVGLAVHWFDMEKFIKAVARILKPRVCVALYCHKLPKLCGYADSPENPAQIIEERFKMFKPYEAPVTKLIWNEYKEIFDAIAFPDKESSGRGRACCWLCFQSSRSPDKGPVGNKTPWGTSHSIPDETAVEHCEQESALREMFRDRLVCGMNNTATQRKPLTEPTLDLKRAIGVPGIHGKGAQELQGSIDGAVLSLG
ncbi:putative methyltransferase DDB_G0268948 [Mustelus asterias]